MAKKGRHLKIWQVARTYLVVLFLPRVTSRHSKPTQQKFRKDVSLFHNLNLSQPLHYPSGTCNTQRQNWRVRGIETTVAADAVRNYLELYYNDRHMCMDVRASECTTTKSMEGPMESIEINVLDDYCTRVGACVGGQTILWCEGDTGWI